MSHAENEQKKITSFAELIEVYKKAYEERYFWHAAINMNCFFPARLTTAEKQTLIQRYQQALKEGKVKDVRPGAQECTFKHLAFTWKVDGRTLNDLKEWLKNRNQYHLKNEEDKTEDKEV